MEERTEVEDLWAKVRCESEKRGREWEGAISLFYLFCYLEWLSPEVQSEVQQERKKKNQGICVQEGIEALNSWQSLAQQ